MTLQAGVWYRGRLKMNTYEFELHFTTNSESTEDHNIALDRIKYFINDQLDSTIFIHQDNTDQIKHLLEAGCSVTTLPEEPVDQIIGMMLFSKFTAIVDDYLKIIELEISSILGGDVWYKHNFLESLGVFEESGWWNQNNLLHVDIRKISKDAKVFKIIPDTDWQELDLHWTSDERQESTDGESSNVIFPDFTRNDH
jgi:hypothetical protein